MPKKSLLGAFVFSWCALFSVIGSVACGQDRTTREDAPRPRLDFKMHLSIGLSSFEDITGTQRVYQDFGIFPEFGYGGWGLGLDLSLEFDGDFRLRDLNNDGKPDRWTTLHDFLTRVHYLSYGRKGDPLYGRIGAFDSSTLGHGLVMDGYSNTLFQPQVIQLGLNLDIDGAGFSFPYVGIEAVADDVLDWDVMGVRITARPLAGAANALLRRLEFGGTFVTDRDPQENPLEAPKDNPASEGVSEYGVDVELPVLEKDRTSLLAYADWAKIADGGSGALVGSTFTHRRLALRGQLRFLGREFVPAYFDSFYEKERGGKHATLAAYDEFSVGYLVGTEMNILDAVAFSVTWIDGIGDPEGPRVLATIGTPKKVLPKIDASLSYEKKDIENFSGFFSDENSLVRLTLGYELGAARIVLTFERAYSPFSLAPADRTRIETWFSF